MAGQNKIEIVISAVDSGLQAVFGKINKAMDSADKASKNYGRSMTAMQGPIRAVTGSLAQLGAAFGAVFATQKFLAVSEAYAGIDARLRLVTDSSDELASVQEKLYELSQKTGTGYQENAATYTKLATALKSAGASSDELIRINEAVSKSLVVAGSGAAEASSFLLQFGQAMGSGVLQGDELRAMLESNSYFAQQLAKALNTDIAGLRKMGSAGELTAAKIREAVPKMLEQINADFAKMPLTIGRAMTMLGNAFGKIVNGSNTAGGATGKIAAAIKEFVSYLDANGKKIEDFAVKLIGMIGNIAKGAWEYKNFIAAFAGTALAVSAIATITTAVQGLSAAFSVLGGSSLISGLGSIVTSLKGIELAALSTTAAIGAAAGASLALIGGYSLGSKIDEWEYFREVVNGNKAAMAEVPAKLGEINSALQTNFSTMEELFAAEKRGEVSFNEMTNTWVKGAGEQSKAVSDSAAKQKQVSGEALDAMKAKYQAYAAEIKRLQDDIANREQSLYDQLRDMARTGMSDVNAWEDLKKQADEYAAKAKAAAAAGDFKEAIASADAAKGLYSQLNTEVKEGDKVLVSQADALKTAMDGVKESGKIGIEALKGQQAAAKEAMNALTEESGFQNLREGMDDAEKAWLENWDNMRAKAISDIDAVEDRLSKIEDRGVTVWINEKVKKALGGMVQKFARGGKLGGYGGGDRISALLEAGEYVIRKEAVAKFGAGLFHQLNSLILPKFATGGQVSVGASAGSGSAAYNITLNYNGSGSRSDASAMTDMIMSELQRRNRRASA